ncbi:hypothetical protein [Undibacterium terreum]|uniref:hypothetical protein n=1 Tax=Undibacterium terreum TaxID=1224302 RepID=UPI001666F659|nr:hypothetical protein [Undibacterium terreum]
MMNIASRPLRALRSFFAAGITALLFSSASAADTSLFDTWHWDLSAAELQAKLVPEDTKELVRTLKDTRSVAEAAAAMLSEPGINQAAMIRFNTGWQTVWVMYRTEQKFVLAELAISPYGGNAVASTSISYRELSQEQWTPLFKRFASHTQLAPTKALAEGTRMLPGRFWPRGYAGVVDTMEAGRSRSYLLATEDVSQLHIRNPIDELLCTTLFAGMHCRAGAEVKDGWVKASLAELIKQPPVPSQQLAIELCSAVQDEKWDIAQEKLDAGAKLDAYLGNGATCESRTRARNKLPQMTWLTSRGALPFQPDLLGRTITKACNC